MKTAADPTRQPALRSNADHVAHDHAAGAVDHRPEAHAQRSLQARADASPQAIAQRTFQQAVDTSPRMVAQRQVTAPASTAAPQKANKTGLPDHLKAGVESLSGRSMDDVKVHYNSARPAQLQAHAYTQGKNIHVAPGQEQHLAHEAWHVIQQKQGRVKPTVQRKGVKINDNTGLEKEADVMGARAMKMKPSEQTAQGGSSQVAQRQVAPHAYGCSCPSCLPGRAPEPTAPVQAKAATESGGVVQLNCKYCGSMMHSNATCPKRQGYSANPNHSAPVRMGKGPRDLRKRKGHGMMTKKQAKRYVPGYKS